MRTIYAAIIEWPSRLTDAEPSLVVARSASERNAEILSELRETADMLTDPSWREVLAAIPADAEWGTVTEALEPTFYGSPYITEYEREFPA